MKCSVFVLAILAVVLSFFSSCKIQLSSPSTSEVKGSWTLLNSNINVDSIISTSTGLIAFSNTPGQPAYYSPDYGASWSPLIAAQTNHPYWVMADISNNAKVMMYSALDSTLYQSTNGGQSWAPLNRIANSTIRAVDWVSGSRLFVQALPTDTVNVPDSLLATFI